MKDDLQLGILKENCLLLKLYRKLRKMFLKNVYLPSCKLSHPSYIYIR